MTTGLGGRDLAAISGTARDLDRAGCDEGGWAIAWRGRRGGNFRTPARDLAAVPAKIHQEHGVEIAIGERRGNQITKKSSHDLKSKYVGLPVDHALPEKIRVGIPCGSHVCRRDIAGQHCFQYAYTISQSGVGIVNPGCIRVESHEE